MDQQVAKKMLESVVQDVLNNPLFEVPWSTNFNEIGGWDSLNNIAIIAEFEKAIGARFSSKDLIAFKTPMDIIAAANTVG